jgi:hypothetical protein
MCGTRLALTCLNQHRLTSLEGYAKQLAPRLVIAATQTATLSSPNPGVYWIVPTLQHLNWHPSPDHGEGKLDHKMRQASRFV